MTSPTSATSSREPAGFTLVELLVVIGIIGVLAGLLLPMVLRSQGQAERLRAANDLQAIAAGLEAYKQDFGDYPRVMADAAVGTDVDHPNPPTGAQVLCWALIGPAGATDPAPVPNRRLNQDGSAGPGFRGRGTSGRAFGPYLQPDKFKVRNPADMNNSTPNPMLACLIDLFDMPILYFPANTARIPQMGVANGFIASSESSVFDFSDNPLVFRRSSEGNDTNALIRFRAMLGDWRGAGGVGTAPDGTITVEPILPGDTPEKRLEKQATSETANTTGPYLLWSAGPDQKFGPDYGGAVPTGEEIAGCDDVTNFERK